MKNRGKQPKTDKKAPLTHEPPADDRDTDAGLDADDADNIPTDTLAEVGEFIAWISEEPDGETVYHLELGQVTLHFFQEEWDDLVKLIREASEDSED